MDFCDDRTEWTLFRTTDLSHAQVLDIKPIILRNLKYNMFETSRELPEISMNVEKGPVHSSFSFDEHFERSKCN